MILFVSESEFLMKIDVLIRLRTEVKQVVYLREMLGKEIN
jgi:hypothetical protein